jgi:hypothetical protein
MPALKPSALPGARADAALGHRPGRRAVQRGGDVRGRDSARPDVGQIAVVRLGHDGIERRRLREGRPLAQIAEQRVGDPEHRQRAGQQHRRLDGAELLDLGRADHLAEAVVHGQARGQRAAARVTADQRVVHDGRDAGPELAVLGVRRLDHGGMPDPDAGHVGDRVGRAGRQPAGSDAEVAGARPG